MHTYDRVVSSVSDALSLQRCLVFKMADLPQLLVASLKPDTRKQAEQNLSAISIQPGFLGVLLQLVLNASQERSVRLAASIYLKNVAKSRWEEVSWLT